MTKSINNSSVMFKLDPDDPCIANVEYDPTHQCITVSSTDVGAPSIKIQTREVLNGLILDLKSHGFKPYYNDGGKEEIVVFKC